MSALLVLGLGAVAVALLLLTLVVLPPGRSRVPLSRLDPTVVPAAPASAFAGAGAAAGAAVEKALARRGRIAAGQAALERAGVATPLPEFVLAVGLVTVIVDRPSASLLGGPLAGLLAPGRRAASARRSWSGSRPAAARRRSPISSTTPCS